MSPMKPPLTKTGPGPPVVSDNTAFLPLSTPESNICEGGSHLWAHGHRARDARAYPGATVEAAHGEHTIEPALENRWHAAHHIRFSFVCRGRASSVQ